MQVWVASAQGTQRAATCALLYDYVGTMSPMHTVQSFTQAVLCYYMD